MAYLTASIEAEQTTFCLKGVGTVAVTLPPSTASLDET